MSSTVQTCEQYIGKIVSFSQYRLGKELIGYVVGFSRNAFDLEEPNFVVSGPCRDLSIVNIYVPELDITFQEWSDRLLKSKDQNISRPMKVLS